MLYNDQSSLHFHLYGSIIINHTTNIQWFTQSQPFSKSPQNYKNQAEKKRARTFSLEWTVTALIALIISCKLALAISTNEISNALMPFCIRHWHQQYRPVEQYSTRLILTANLTHACWGKKTWSDKAFNATKKSRL